LNLRQSIDFGPYPVGQVHFRTCQERDLLQVQMWYHWKARMLLPISE